MRPPEDVKRELVQQWLAKADEDLGAAAHLLLAVPPLWASVGFHCQQASEKYLKALLVAYQTEFPKTHDLGLLLDLVAETNMALAADLRDVVLLTDYGVDVRYPGVLLKMTAAGADEALTLTQRVREAVRSSLRSAGSSR